MKPSRPSPNTSPSILSRAARLLALLVAAAALFVPGLASADDAESLTYQITTQGREVGTRTLKVHYLGTETGELRLMALLFGPQRAGEGILTLSMAARTWREHMVLVRHLERGDGAGAQAWMAEHIAAARRHLLAWYDHQVHANDPTSR